MSEIEYNDRHTRFFPQPLDYQVAENSVCSLLKKTQRQGARTSPMADSLWHIGGPYEPYAISHTPQANRSEAIERNEADEAFSAAC